MKMTAVSKRNGFTLMEILIAIFILAIVLSTVYAAYTGTLRVVKETEYDDDIYSMARCAMKRMTEDIESVYRYKGVFNFTSERTEISGEDFMNLAFFSSAHLSFDDEDSSGIAAMNFYVKEDSGREGCVLMREDTLHKDDEDKEAEIERGFILCDRVQSLTYKFYDSEGEECDSWDSGSEAQKDSAPSVVSIHLTFINPDDKENPCKFMTKVFLPMAGKK